MGFKNWPYWSRGLLFGVIVGVIPIVFQYIEYLKCEANPIAYGDALRCFGPSIGLSISIWIGLGISLLGLIIGLIYGKIKARR
jgi:hypothetical protein